MQRLDALGRVVAEQLLNSPDERGLDLAGCVACGDPSEYEIRVCGITHRLLEAQGLGEVDLLSVLYVVIGGVRNPK